MKDDRRGFFKKIFGGAAAIALAPNVAAPKLSTYEKKFVDNSLLYEGSNYALSGVCPPQYHFGIFIVSGLYRKELRKVK